MIIKRTQIAKQTYTLLLKYTKAYLKKSITKYHELWMKTVRITFLSLDTR